jgi:hypothetical protein
MSYREFLCKLGFHAWTLLGFTSLTLSDSLEECRVCGKGRAWFVYGQAYALYTPEQMANYKALLSKRHIFSDSKP